ncbi:MAG: glutamine amidotransferase, partial [Rhodobacter sp.]|nr:glutamine amidotransferase [Rhodobacter sp.]
MKPFLILQLRPEPAASDNEYQAFLDKGALTPDQTRRIRLEHQDIPADLNLVDYSGVIVGGGPGCVSDPPDAKSPLDQRIEDAVLALMPEITERDIPFMGCCYGIGILAHHLGAEVSKARYGEPVGASTCTQTSEGRTDPMLAGCPETFDSFVGH